MAYNLPSKINDDSSGEVKSFFDKYFRQQITFPSNQIDIVLGFFLKRGWDLEAARSTAIVLLTQSKIDNVEVMELLDTIKTLNDAQLSNVVTQVLNAYREKTSTLGFKLLTIEETTESRNIRV